MQIEKAAAIGGWMSGPELMWLATQASTHKRIVEVGSWQGRTTRVLADNTAGEVFAVDTWKCIPALKSHWQGDSEWLWNAFQANLSDLSNVHPIRSTSLDAAQQLMQSQFDMIFIDACHDYESVAADIKAWEPLLISGGLLCGHDYADPDYGVTKAVNELLPEAVCVVDSIWAMTKR